MNRHLMDMDIQAKIQDKYKIRRKLEAAEKSYKELQERLEELKDLLNKEESDVKKLEGMNISSLFYSILGTKEERLDKERQEYLAAKLNYEECMDELKALEKDIHKLKLEMGEIDVLERKYQDILRKKEEMLANKQDNNSEQLADQSESLARARRNAREIQEAIDAGRMVIAGLEKVLNHLDSARNWGIWDMVGGGIISSAIKHSRIDDAKNEARNVQYLLRQFEKELKDVGQIQHLNIEVGSFATFADYFFDGLIADWVVQSRINQSRENTARMLRKAERLVQDLRSALKKVESEIKNYS